MKKYAVSIARSGDRHAGGKARSDLIDILLDDGWTEFNIQGGSGKVGKILHRLKTLLTLLVLPRSSVFCTQFPINTAYARLAMKMMARRYRTIAIIHDIDSFRGSIEPEKEAILKDFTVCIATGMLNQIAPKGARFLPDGNLPAIDYRLAPSFKEIAYDPSGKILFAGRLSAAKSAWIYDKSRSGAGLLLYGPEFEATQANPIDSYGGSFDPSNPVIAEPVSFGLVWDGDRLDTCAGPMGEYMRHNYPHKLSLYLSLGLPVIIWSAAATAKLVRERKVGIVVDTLEGLSAQIDAVSPEDRAEMRNNAMAMAHDLRQGRFLKDTIAKTMAEIGS